MNYLCDDCCEAQPAQAFKTVGRGWKFLCVECFEYASPLLRSYCEPFQPGRHYPTYDYDARTLK